MSQIEVKIVKISGKFNIFSTDLLTILTSFVATDVYVLFNSPQNCIKPRGGGSRAIYTMYRKNICFGRGWLPLDLVQYQIEVLRLKLKPWAPKEKKFISFIFGSQRFMISVWNFWAICICYFVCWEKAGGQHHYGFARKRLGRKSPTHINPLFTF